MHYFLISGEASGDLHGSRLIEAIRRLDKDPVFTFLGGDMMARAARCEPIVHYRDMAFMGFVEVLKNIRKVSANLRTAKEALRMARPDCLILIDYPSFNLKVASVAHREGIPVYYYISPKIWAWKKWRIHDIRRLVRRMYSILPFEPEFYRQNGFRAEYVGNPSVEEVDLRMAVASSREEFLAQYKLRDRPLVALMPGSRKAEIHNNLAVMNLALSQFPQYRGVIIGAPGISDDLYKACGAGNIPVIRPESAVDALVHCRAALVTSGTATLETALVGIPQVVMYRGNGTKLTYDIMKRVLDIDFVSLPNLIVGRQIIPEMLQHMCSPAPVAELLGPLLRNGSEQRSAQIEGYAEMRRILGTKKAASTAAESIYKDLSALMERAQS
ncbi:MAG: lipid-A-disaccharide synthase [Muribaculaceae bacterium]|nr:lipid-A-disaccharide synthase [Muribaculaceae bacterium]